MKIDLSIGAKLSPIISIKIDEVSQEIRSLYSDLISDVSIKNGLDKNILWWVCSPASRNTITSPLFFYLCGIQLIKKLLEEDYFIEEISVGSFAQKRILEKVILNHSKSIPVLCSKGSSINKYKSFKINLKNCFKTFKEINYRLSCAKKTRHLTNPINEDPITLIDTFSFPGHVIEKRYYTGLLEYLTNAQKSLIYFVPTVFNIKQNDIFETYKKLRSNKLNYILKEDFLKLTDIIKVLFSFLKVSFLNVKKTLFCDSDISDLIKEELYNLNGHRNSIEALLNIQFAKRLKKDNIKLKLVINFFENQVIDKGWNFGFNLVYPKIKTIGYRGYIASSLYLCTMPTYLERKSSLIPKEIHVIGKSQLKSIKEFDPKLIVKISPALRFSHLWGNYSIKSNSSSLRIFVVLPILPDECKTILNYIIYYIKKTKRKNVQFIIKVHPTMDGSIIEKIIGKKYKNTFVITREPFIDSLLISDVLISGMSGAALESIIFGIPLLLMRNNFGITFNAIPLELKEYYWSTCENKEHFTIKLEEYLNTSKEDRILYKKYGKKVRVEYFEKVNLNSVKTFLSLT